MSQATTDHRTRAEIQTSTLTLVDILHNSLILLNTAPFLPIASLLSLSATNREFRDLLYQTPGVFRYLDLTQTKTAQLDIFHIDSGGETWRNVQLDENLTEDDFYSGPLRGVFSTLRRRHILQDVQTLVLDGLAVTSDLCYEIINDSSYSVRILSVRDVKYLNQGKLRGALSYACRSSRPDDAPRLKALYVFGSKDPVPAQPLDSSEFDLGAGTGASIITGWNHKSQNALASSLHRRDAWWSRKGQVFTKHISEDWVNCLLACEGLIAFDAVLCRGPRHRNSPAFGKAPLAADSTPAVASFALPACDGCGTAPEGLVYANSSSPAALPLLAPPPLLSSSVRAATAPQNPSGPCVARCADCVARRYCAGCHKWWCESCYQIPGQIGHAGHGQPANIVVIGEEGSWETPGLELATAAKPKARVSKSCWECGNNCDACIDATQRVCKKCCGGYCIIHNEGSSSTYCDWCVSRGRGLGRL